jgi:two-component system, cell cycle sensor histidine kinase and response regulator CckA
MNSSPMLLSLLSCISDAVILFDHEQLVVHLNREAESLTGWDLKEALGKPLATVCRLVDQPSRRPLEDLVEKAVASGGNLELRGVTVVEGRDGSEHLIKGSVFITEPGSGSHLGGGLVFEDITTRWMVDSAVRKASRSEYYRTLAAGIAHNLEDLSTTLLVRLAGIEHSIREGHPASSGRLIIEAENLVRRMSETGSGLLDTPSSWDSREGIVLVENAIRNSLRSLGTIYQEMVLEVALPDRTGYAAIPSDLFEQVLNGCLMNAIEAQGGSGRITVSACRLHLESDMKPIPVGDYAMVVIRDQGPGISEHNLTRIFEPLFTTKGEGRGLGLPAIWSIVHQFGGFLAVDSEPGHGAVFGVFIPSAPGASVESASDRLPRVLLSGLAGELADSLRVKLSAIGCTILGEGSERVGSGSAAADLVILAEGAEPPTGGAAVIRLLPAGAGSSWSAPPGAVVLRRPEILPEVLDAVASVFWSRELPAFMQYPRCPVNGEVDGEGR